ncbi:hypothetical protein EB817_02955 [Streptococcus pyogenes]|nr:hypothetical protein EB817_02955 [Streptococcus pyogenes]
MVRLIQFSKVLTSPKRQLLYSIRFLMACQLLFHLFSISVFTFFPDNIYCFTIFTTALLVYVILYKIVNSFFIFL